MRTLSKRLGTTLAALALAAPWTASGCGGGGGSGNVPAGARTVDLLALDTESCLLEVKATAPGTWAGARLAFDPASIEARDPAGVPVVVTATDSGAAADFAAPITVMAGED